MAYTKQTWQNEVLSGVSADQALFTIKNSGGSIINDDVIIELKSTEEQAGSEFTADRMNHIEDGIEANSAAFDASTGHDHDGTDSKKIAYANITGSPILNNAGSHNSIYRGSSLGTSVSAAQYASISAGTFEDMYIGDYWTISGVVWRIAAFDYYYNVGDVNCTTHHVVVVPDTVLYNAKMNTTNITTNAYWGSEMYTANLAAAKSTIDSAFGSSHVLNHRIMLANTLASGQTAPTSWAWYDSTVELMTEMQVYGSRACGAPANNGYGVGSQDGVFPLFAIRHGMIHIRNNYWLQDVASAAAFAFVSYNGYATNGSASESLGVRPAFCLKS